MLWDLDEIAAIARRTIEARVGALRAAQESLGIDAQSELELHGALADGFLRHGLGVWRESPYPRGAVGKRSEGERCDLVLTRSAVHGLADPYATGTLFAHCGVPAGEALWLEVKVIGQHDVIDGVGRANPSYGARLLREPASDARKLARDPSIDWAALLVLVFTRDHATAEHDLGVWLERSRAALVPIGTPIVLGIDIPDHIGNGWASVVVARVHRM